MRTTVDIEDPILKELRALQKREGTTLGALVSRLLAQALAQQRRPVAPAHLAWHSQPMQARVDLADKDAVYAILDGSSRAAEP